MCGIFGIFNARKAAELAVIGLHGNQHRAIDYAGMVSSDGVHMYRESGAGIARQVFTKAMLDRLHGKHALGHLRYPTVNDDPRRDNTQPIVGRYGGNPTAIAHNGNITNLQALRARFPDVALSTSMDTEYILRILELVDTGDIRADLQNVFSELEGSFALGILLPEMLIAVRDKSGNRPLSIGKFEQGFCISSEDCVFPNLGATSVMEVKPGTMVLIDIGGIEVVRFAEAEEKKCRFEGIYYSHPSSIVFGEDVTQFRLAVGRKLEELFPVPNADLVTAVPDSSTLIALGYGESGRSGKYHPVIFRNHYVGRTFIAATEAKRDIAVSQKYTFSATGIAEKIVVIVDDSIVRGPTSSKIVRKFRELGAREIHLRIGSPPNKHPCRYGINMPTSEELLASYMTEDEMCVWIGADSLEFLPLEVLKGLSSSPENFCFACMDGKYW